MSIEKALMRANALSKRGDYLEARSVFFSVLEKYPGNRRALEGITRLERASRRLAPRNLTARLRSLYRSGRFQELVDAAQEVTTLYPDDTDLLALLGAGHAALGQSQAAIETFNKIIALNPGDADAYGNRGNAQRATGDCEAALDSYNNVLLIQPDDPAALNNIGRIYIDRGRLDAAIAQFRSALSVDPSYGPALNNLGNALKISGDLKGAADVFAIAIRQGTCSAETLWNFASVTTFEAGFPAIPTMKNIFADDRRSMSEKMLSGFALGKAFDDIGDTNQAFYYYNSANTLRKSISPYLIEEDIKAFNLQRDVFSADRTDLFGDFEFRKYQKSPIFIVGMPRSGTSLIEQMISSHSEIFGGGEFEHLNTALSALEWRHPYAFQLEGMRIADAYLAHLKKQSGNEQFVTDKLPVNFLWIGAIFALFPDAKIVHVRRDARATCWSNYKHYYASDGNGFAYDLGDLAAFYLEYLDLMKHWDRLFGDRIFTVDYDALVEAPEPLTRDLLTYLGVPWQDNCLRPEENQRAVYTSSAAQVRNGIYTRSSRDWERYSDLIGSAFDTLPTGRATS